MSPSVVLTQELPVASWYFPATHDLHDDAPVLPLLVPAAQSEHETTFETVEYFPAAHAVQVLAAAPVLPVMDPAAQVVQDALFETVEYFPATHAVHDEAPTPVLPVMYPL